jgi:hypothetical protein
LSLALLLFCCFQNGFALSYEELTKNFVTGKADIQSMSVLSFGPEGILFVGDSKAGKVFALDLGDRVKNAAEEPFKVEDIESKLGSALGVGPKEVILHDLAVNPVSQSVYLAVSRADAMKVARWILPNDIAYATILVKVKPDGSIEEVSLDNIRHSSVAVPKVIEPGKTNFRKSDERTDAITDIAYDDGKLYVAGLSNEAFASALRILNFPFDDKATHSTLEVWHVAHKKSETEAPIRTLLPYSVKGEKFILASYTCTPFVSIPVGELKPGAHVKNKTLAEFGSGNMPIDIIACEIGGRKYLLMSNSSKALIRIDPENIAKQEKGLTEPMADGQYTVGMPHDVLSNVGVSQLDNLNAAYVLAVQRQPNGNLDLFPIQTKRR